MVSLRLYLSLVLRKEWVTVSIVTQHCVGDRHEDIAELEAAPYAWNDDPPGVEEISGAFFDRYQIKLYERDANNEGQKYRNEAETIDSVSWK